VKIHHLGRLVHSIEESYKVYFKTFSNLSSEYQVFDIKSQKVKVSFMQIEDQFCIELIEPYPENKALLKLANKGVTYYHIGYTVEDINTELARLEAIGYKKMSIFKSEAFEHRKCCFLLSPTNELIELIEK